jgi:hypothetical protein
MNEGEDSEARKRWFLTVLKQRDATARGGAILTAGLSRL